MLKILRNRKTAKKIWIGLALIIIPAFVFWGFSGALRSRDEAGASRKVFGRTVTMLEYSDALLATRNQAIMQFGDKFKEVEKFLNLEGQAWERIILLSEAKRRRISAGDREVVEQVESYPFFQNKGRFDKTIYSQMLQYFFRTQPRAFEEQVRQNIMLSKLLKEVTKNVAVNDAMVREEYQKLNQEISVSYISSSPEEFRKEINPAEGEIKDYFAKNQLQFKEPPAYNLEYISSADQKQLVTLAKYRNKSGFDKMVREAGLSIKETGLFPQAGPIPGIGWSQEVMDLIAKLKVGQFTPPIQLESYYYFLKLKDKKEAYIPELDKVKDKVREFMINEAAGKKAREAIGSCLQELKSGQNADFNRVAREFGAKTGTTEPFKFASYIEGIGASDDFWLEAQKLKDGQASGILKAQNAYYIIKVKSKGGIDENKFAKEKEEFSQRVLMQKRQETFIKFSEDLKKKAL